MQRSPGGPGDKWETLISERLPPASSVGAAGTRTRETRKLLRSFRWNLQVLSYIALIVGAFLVYNTVSVSVVRRRPLIGVARALGMASRSVRLGFLAEGFLFGIVGTAAGLALGRAIAVGAVELMGRTVEVSLREQRSGRDCNRAWDRLGCPACRDRRLDSFGLVARTRGVVRAPYRSDGKGSMGVRG